MKIKLSKIVIASSLLIFANMSYAEGVKRFSVSAGWLHVMPQGKANPFNINTSVKNGTVAKVGSISPTSFLNSVDPNATEVDVGGEPFNQKEFLELALNDDFLKGFLLDEEGNIKPEVAGEATIQGLEQWHQNDAGLEVDDTDTLGLMFNYYLNDNVSLQFIGGIPPKVDIKGQGEILAPLSGVALSPHELVKILFPNGITLGQAVPITNLGNKPKAASVRAWTPAIEAQYQFGKSGVNKFRPYLGVGLMYAHFNDIKLNDEIRSDLISAGHMIQNVLDGKAGAALDRKESSGNMVVKVDADDAIAPIFTAGFTYDFNDSWYTVASVSYAKLNNRTQIDVINQNTGARLIHGSTKVDIDPIITYLGVGYRF
ncbi:OmpW family outer membrane protein [Acinetobacter baumannii]|uniref:OmpW/AlkL family protein n=1 Tax=Acinetobacter baumannii TaxID=470 RepID=UPI000352B8DE|nr:OmpW family outer membrane protein [Acinetobacter baumannii]EPG40499.1 outer membrane protein [Acinetobacter baumannii NIPH 410]MDN8335514.1 OmpW family outer membrane protein [Acinetobacter baumannii]HCA5021809.1 OmpW family protein [Acinetobacter baumannii]HDX6139753.1 OmpW family protein [Acinetobacter baumannii]